MSSPDCQWFNWNVSSVFVVANGDCSVKPERQNNVETCPVCGARLDQPRCLYNGNSAPRADGQP